MKRLQKEMVDKLDKETFRIYRLNVITDNLKRVFPQYVKIIARDKEKTLRIYMFKNEVSENKNIIIHKLENTNYYDYTEVLLYVEDGLDEKYLISNPNTDLKSINMLWGAIMTPIVDFPRRYPELFKSAVEIERESLERNATEIHHIIPNTNADDVDTDLPNFLTKSEKRLVVSLINGEFGEDDFSDLLDCEDRDEFLNILNGIYHSLEEPYKAWRRINDYQKKNNLGW